METIEMRGFPRDDPSFVREVKDAVERLTLPDPTNLEAALRALYPAVRVVEQIPLGRLGQEVVWYIYRDGSLVDQRPAADESHAGIRR